MQDGRAQALPSFSGAAREMIQEREGERMAKKGDTVFVCQECGMESPRWMGQCACGAWNSMVEEKASSGRDGDPRRRREPGTVQKAVPLKDVQSGQHRRIDTGIGELNRVLGGGLVQGSLCLISGEPGIGKSTLIIQAAARISAQGKRVLYVTGEESEEQIKIRADRVCGGDLEQLFLLSETCMENVLAVQETLQPDFMIIDSIQTMYTEELDSAPGSVSQVRMCGNYLMKIGKGRHIPIFLVAHVTKSGELAGPKILEHLVDCVLSFTGERTQELRMLRAVKNRYGTTSELGAFEMIEEGLVEVENLSGTFLEGMDESVAGSIATAVYEGTRPLLLEIQALTVQTVMSFPRRTTVGVDAARLNMILAVLERKTDARLGFMDVYVNIVGGLKPEGTSTDLAVALAVYSAAAGKVIDAGILAVGEIGLTGDLRSIRNGEKIVREAARMGFGKIILPEKNALQTPDPPAGVRLCGVRTVQEAIAAL